MRQRNRQRQRDTVIHIDSDRQRDRQRQRASQIHTNTHKATHRNRQIDGHVKRDR